jgi:hypothetical protein
MRKTLGSEVYKKAKELSYSKTWEPLLYTPERRMRFEDGYVAGWFACHRQKKKKS